MQAAALPTWIEGGLLLIDVSQALDRIETTLSTSDSELPRRRALEILGRWRDDEQLIPECRRRAEELLLRFQSAPNATRSAPDATHKTNK